MLRHGRKEVNISYIYYGFQILKALNTNLFFNNVFIIFNF